MVPAFFGVVDALALVPAGDLAFAAAGCFLADVAVALAMRLAGAFDGVSPERLVWSFFVSFPKIIR